MGQVIWEWHKASQQAGGTQAFPVAWTLVSRSKGLPKELSRYLSLPASLTSSPSTRDILSRISARGSVRVLTKGSVTLFPLETATCWHSTSSRTQPSKPNDREKSSLRDTLPHPHLHHPLRQQHLIIAGVWPRLLLSLRLCKPGRSISHRESPLWKSMPTPLYASIATKKATPLLSARMPSSLDTRSDGVGNISPNPANRRLQPQRSMQVHRKHRRKRRERRKRSSSKARPLTAPWITQPKLANIEKQLEAMSLQYGQLMNIPLQKKSDDKNFWYSQHLWPGWPTSSMQRYVVRMLMLVLTLNLHR